MYSQAKDQEAQLLSALSAQPVPVRYAHLLKVAKTYDDAFEFDPLMLYVRAGEKRPRAARRARDVTLFLAWKRRKTMLTVNDGNAFIVIFVNPDERQTPFERLFDLLTMRLYKAFAGKVTAEQRKRLDEAATKMRAIIEETIGGRVSDMVSIDILATEPASQGRGYGSSLVQASNDLADSLGKASWLMAIETNTPFYNSLGFETVGIFYMGERNPDWTEKPIPVHMMVREAQNKLDIPPPKKSSRVFNSFPISYI